MSDYPRNFVVPTHINPWMKWSLGRVRGLPSGVNGNAVWTGLSNTAMYIPFMLDWPYNVRRMFWCNGATPGANSDIGIYTLGGARLWSSGSVACVGTGVPQYLTPSPDILLQSGVPYFMAFAHDSPTSNTFTGSSTTLATTLGRACGLYLQASAFPLPLQATFAAYATALNLPLIGFTNTGSGF